MTANAPTQPAYPVRGVPGGWVDVWDDPIDHAALRAAVEARERRLREAVAREGVSWRAEAMAERRAREREQDRARRSGG